MRWRQLWVVALVGCIGPTVPPSAPQPSGVPQATVGRTVRLLFGGDVMLGRGVASATASDPQSSLEGIRFQVSSADLAVANLESPLTARPHESGAGPNALEAPKSSASLLGSVGFDAMGVANNHAGDAGPSTVTDTVSALSAAGLVAVGGGSSQAVALAPSVVEVGGLRVALLAFDTTGQGPPAGPDTPGVAWWDEALARQAVARARVAADIVAVGLHGGTEYAPTSDPYLARLGQLLGSWGVDVVWGQGPHVVQPISTIDPDGDGRITVFATSLGNLLFDQHVPGTEQGALLEVVAGADGIRALRVGATQIAAGSVAFRGWREPEGDAVALGNHWWVLARAVEPAPARRPGDLSTFAERKGDVVDAVVGDPDGDGRTDLVVAFRRPFRPTSVNALLPRHDLVDALGRSAHVGLYRPSDLSPRWVAGTVVRPVARLTACDGALAVAYSGIDDPAVVATGAWRWGGFGFLPLADLPGSGEPGCADVDGDGRLDPVVLGRTLR